jgi:hypothetical protein
MSAHCDRDLHNAITSALADFSLVEDAVTNWSNLSTEVLKIFISEQALTLEEVKEIVHNRIITLGKKSLMAQCHQYSDTATSHHALAYALKYGAFTAQEEHLLRCDHGETKEDFINQYAIGLKERIIEQLLDKENT